MVISFICHDCDNRDMDIITATRHVETTGHDVTLETE